MMTVDVPPLIFTLHCRICSLDYTVSQTTVKPVSYAHYLCS